jgi:hypothetical protein
MPGQLDIRSVPDASPAQHDASNQGETLQTDPLPPSSLPWKVKPFGV